MERRVALRVWVCAGRRLFTLGRASCGSTQQEAAEDADATSPQPSLPNLGIGPELARPFGPGAANRERPSIPTLCDS
jgi:hypothetical protein